MKILDGHIHIEEEQINRADFLQKLQLAGISGGVVMSLPPASFIKLGRPLSADWRLDNLFAWIEGTADLFPFFWIDPLEDDASDQVDLAIRRGVNGFKVICNRFFPREKQPIAVFTKIARAGLPLLFHSGILWDAQDTSRYNRPAEFEALLDIPGLKFSLAHISWPWCDELIAVYGKFQNANKRDDALSVEMFIDITPGTPPVYRQEALTKLFTVGYDVKRNVIFGTDCLTHNYDHRWTSEWIARDNTIYRQLGLEQETLGGIYSENLNRFLK